MIDDAKVQEGIENVIVQEGLDEMDGTMKTSRMEYLIYLLKRWRFLCENRGVSEGKHILKYHVEPKFTRLELVAGMALAIVGETWGNVGYQEAVEQVVEYGSYLLSFDSIRNDPNLEKNIELGLQCLGNCVPIPHKCPPGGRTKAKVVKNKKPKKARQGWPYRTVKLKWS